MSRTKERTRSGNWLERYVAVWPTRQGAPEEGELLCGAITVKPKPVDGRSQRGGAVSRTFCNRLLGQVMRPSALVAFYRGSGRDHRGRLLSDIHTFDFNELEFHHDYIQWLFPLPEPSGANASSPLLSNEDIAAFTSDDSLRKALLQSFELMLQFYGLELAGRGEDIKVVRGANFDERSNLWLTSGNHNFLRITRILRSLSLLGLSEYAVAFLERLQDIYAENASIIGTTTMGYWRRAVEPRRHEGTKR